MKITKSFCVYLVSIALAILSLLIFHKVPVHQLWTGYETLAVPVSVSEKDVLDIEMVQRNKLKKNQVKGF